MRFLFLTFVVAWSSIGFIATEPKPYDVSEERRQDSLERVIDKANDFAPDFFGFVGQNQSGKFVAAPYETFMGLSKLYFATETSTREELAAELELLAEDCQEVQYGYQALTDRFNSIKNSSMNSSNTIFYPDHLKPREFFEKVMLWTFRDEAKGINSQNLNEARDTINAWSANRTNYHITNLVKSEDLTTEPSLVLGIVAHFKGLWAPKFFEQNRTLKENSTETSIRAIDYFNYGNINEFPGRYVEMPCKSDDSNKSMSMFLIIPDKIDSFSNVENYVQQFLNLEYLNGAKRKVDLIIPKFTIRSRINLNDALQNMKLIEMFDKTADFGGIFDPPTSTKVHKVIQEVVVEVEANQHSWSHQPDYKLERFIVNEEDAFIFMIIANGEKPVTHLIGYYTGI